MTAAAIADLKAGKALAPAVFLIYRSGPIATPEDYQSVLITQRWLVICVARYADPTGAGFSARASAGGLADLVFQALHTWQPASAHQPLILTSFPAAEYLGSLQLLPLEFETQIRREVTP